MAVTTRRLRSSRGGGSGPTFNEQWEFDEHGLMRRREASINEIAIAARDRRFDWPLGPRPDDHPGLTELGL